MNPNVLLCVIVYVVTVALGVAWYVVDGVYNYDASTSQRVNRVTGAVCHKHPEGDAHREYRWTC